MLRNFAFALAFIVIGIGVHVVFQNIRQIFLHFCKFVVTAYIWGVLWVLVQINQLPEWQHQLSESVSLLVNMTRVQVGRMTESEL